MKFSSHTTVSLPIPEREPSSAQPEQTPILQRINALLELSTLNPFERNFLLSVKCREQPIILTLELAAIAAIWAIHKESE